MCSWRDMGSLIYLDTILIGDRHQDNVTAHKSRVAIDWLQASSEFRHFHWPPKSPDMNIFEYIWNTLKRTVQKKSPPLLTPTYLWTALQDSWGVSSPDWQRFQDDGNVSRRYKTSHHRVKMLNKNWYIYLAVTAKRNRRSTSTDLSRQLSLATGTTVSKQTVYRRLGHIGLYARRPVRCVFHLIQLTVACGQPGVENIIVGTDTVGLCDV
ncbi:transposable element Tcb1 transposase [Trichonephila clavipes]|nr:transposable element Tcb1 transposase [Trichonephila clavipes]